MLIDADYKVLVSNAVKCAVSGGFEICSFRRSCILGGLELSFCGAGAEVAIWVILRCMFQHSCVVMKCISVIKLVFDASIIK